ncbi:MAG: FKBP-type peptidyl-prolyl cis-trans isomerase [Alistipes sp.]|nr:FKBP-type peptidyl-prolyl cis-trans isomerase [Alistipes sp.]
MPRKNKEASEAWLAKVEKQKGVNKTESGLLYRIDREGDAVKPTGKDMVKCNYEGKLRDGFVFDSSYERGEPAEFPLSGVIPGWTEGLQLIGQGGQITLWIPSELAYGQGGAGGGMIGPNEALEFKVELIEVTPTEAPAVPATPIAE